MTSCVRAKVTYRAFGKLEVFYTGGSVQPTTDERSVVCACGDEVKVVELASGNVQRAFPGDTEPITALAVSPNGQHLFTSSRSLTSKCWDLHTGQCVRTWRAHTVPTADIAVDASGGIVATASADREVRVWDVSGGFCTHSFSGHSGVVLKVLFHPTQLLLASAGDDATIQLWDLIEKKSAGCLKAHFSAVTSLAWSPDEWHLLSAGRDKVAIVWDIRTQQKLKTIAVFESVESLVVLPAHVPVPGSSSLPAAKQPQSAVPQLCFATSGEEGRVKVWDTVSGNAVYKQGKPAGGRQAKEIVELLLLPRSASLVSASADCRITVLKCTAAALKHKQTLLGNNDEITALSFVGACVPTESLSMKLTGAVADVTRPGSMPPQLALASNSDAIHVLASSTMNCDMTLVGHTDTVLCIATAQLKSGSWVLVSGSKDRTVRVWDGASGKCVGHGIGHLSAVSALALARKGAPFLVSGSVDKLARVWNLEAVCKALEAGELLETPIKLSVSATVAAHDKAVNCVAVAPNNTLAATGGADRVAKLWQLPALSAPLTLRGHKRGIWDIQFAPVDQVVMTASGDASIRLWSVRDGACLKSLTGHGASVLRASFMSAGTQIVSTGGDGLIKLWNIRSGECVNTIEAHDDKIWALDKGGTDDDVLITGGNDGALVLWADCTAADEDRKHAAEEARLVQQQDLANALMDKNFLKAARLAFKLRHPGRLLEIIKTALAQAAGPASGLSSGGDAMLIRLVKGFSMEEVAQSLAYLRDWNTSSRNCHYAQAMMHAIFASHHPEKLAELQGVQDISEALLLYSERHTKRMDRLLQSTFFLDYLLSSMNVVTASEADALTKSTGHVSEPSAAAAPDTRYTDGLAALRTGDVQALGGNNGDGSGSDQTAAAAASGFEDAQNEDDPFDGESAADVLVRVADESAVEAGVEDDEAAEVGTPASADNDMPGWGGGFELAGAVEGDSKRVEEPERTADAVRPRRKSISKAKWLTDGVSGRKKRRKSEADAGDMPKRATSGKLKKRRQSERL